MDPFICIQKFVRNWLSFPLEAISINSVLLVFKVNLFAFNQSLTWDRSAFNLCSNSAGVFPAHDRLVSWQTWKQEVPNWNPVVLHI